MSISDSDYDILNNLKELKNNIIKKNPFYNDNWYKSNKSNCSDNLVISRKSSFLNKFIEKINNIPVTNGSLTKYTDFIKDNKFIIGLNIDVNTHYHPINYIKSKTSSVNPFANDKKWNTYENGYKLRDNICENIVKFYTDYINLLKDFITLYKLAINNRLNNIFYNRCRPRERGVKQFYRAYYDNTIPSSFKINYETNLFENASKELKELLSTSLIKDGSTTDTDTKTSKYNEIKDILVRPFDIKDKENCYTWEPYLRKSKSDLISTYDEKWITGYSNLIDSELIPDVLSNESSIIKNSTTASIPNTSMQNILNNKDIDNTDINNLINRTDFSKNESNIYKDIETQLSELKKEEAGSDGKSTNECDKFIINKSELLNNNINWIKISKFFINKYNKILELLKDEVDKIMKDKKELYLNPEDISEIRSILKNNIILLNLDNNNLIDTELFNKNEIKNTLKNLTIIQLNEIIGSLESIDLGIVALELIFSHFINNVEFSLKRTQDKLLENYITKCSTDPSKIANYKLEKFKELLGEYRQYINSGFKDDVCATLSTYESALEKIEMKKKQLINFILDTNFLNIFLFKLDNVNDEIKIGSTTENFDSLADKILSNTIFNDYFNKSINKNKFKFLDDEYKDNAMSNKNKRYTSIDSEINNNYDLPYFKNTEFKKDEHNKTIISIINNVINYNDTNFKFEYDSKYINKTCKWLTVFEGQRKKIMDKLNTQTIQQSYIEPIKELLTKIILYAILANKFGDSDNIEFINKLKGLENRLSSGELKPNPITNFRVNISDDTFINSPDLHKPEISKYSDAITVAWDTPKEKDRVSKINSYTLTISDNTNNNPETITVPGNSDNYHYNKYNTTNQNEYTFYKLSEDRNYNITIIGTTSYGTQTALERIYVKTNVAKDENKIKEHPNFNPNIKPEFLDYNKIKINWNKADTVVHIPIKNYIIKIVDNTDSNTSNNTTVLGSYTKLGIDYEIKHDTDIELEPTNNTFTIEKIPNGDKKYKVILTAKNEIDNVSVNISAASSSLSSLPQLSDYETEINIPEFKPDPPTLEAGSTNNTEDTIYFKFSKPNITIDKNKFIKKFVIELYKDVNNTYEPVKDATNTPIKKEFNIGDKITDEQSFNNLDSNSKYQIKAKSILDDTVSPIVESDESTPLELFTVLELPNIDFKTQIHDTKIIIEIDPNSFINYNLDFNNTKFKIKLSTADANPVRIIADKDVKFKDFSSSSSSLSASIQSSYNKYEKEITGLIEDSNYILKITLETKDIENKQYIKEIYTKDFKTLESTGTMPTTFTGGAYRKYVLRRSSKSNKNRISISPKSLKKISKKSPKQYRKVFDQYYGSK